MRQIFLLPIAAIILFSCTPRSAEPDKAPHKGEEMMQKVQSFSELEKELSNPFRHTNDSAIVRRSIDSMTRVYQNYPLLKAILTGLKGNLYNSYNCYESADSLYKKTLEFLATDTNRIIKGYTYYRIAKNNLFHNNLADAFSAIETSLSIFTACNEKQGIYTCFQFLGNYYYLINNLEKAYECYKKAEELVVWSSNPNSGIRLQYNQANCLIHSNPQKAQDTYRQILQKLDTVREYAFYAKILNSMGECSKNLNQPVQAEQLFKHSIAMRKSHNPSPPLDEPLINLYSLYIQQNNLKSAAALYAQIGKTIDPKSACYLDFIYQSTLLEIKTGAHHSAARLLVYFKQLSDSVTRAEYTSNLIELQKNFDLREKNLQIKLLETDNRHNEVLLSANRFIIFILAFLAIVVTAFLILNYRQKKKLNKATEALQQKNETIEKINQQLHHSNKARERILAIVGHDLRGPVGSLRELIDVYLSLGDYNSGDIHKMLQTAKEATAGTYLLLDNLLNWANAQQGKLQLEPELVTLQTTVQQIATGLGNSATLKQIEMVAQIEPHVVVWADPNMLQAILRNLIANAIKYSPPHSTIHIETQSDDNQTTIQISDEGRGMSSEFFEQLLSQKEHLFMSQHEHTVHGSGLGLLICADFMKRHSGIFSFQPRSPQGSTFSIVFPTPTKA